MTLELRMEQILKKNPIENTTGPYRNALNRLVKKGKAIRTKSGWRAAVTIH